MRQKNTLKRDIPIDRLSVSPWLVLLGWFGLWTLSNVVVLNN